MSPTVVLWFFPYSERGSYETDTHKSKLPLRRSVPVSECCRQLANDTTSEGFIGSLLTQGNTDRLEGPPAFLKCLQDPRDPDWADLLPTESQACDSLMHARSEISTKHARAGRHGALESHKTRVISGDNQQRATLNQTSSQQRVRCAAA